MHIRQFLKSETTVVGRIAYQHNALPILCAGKAGFDQDTAQALPLTGGMDRNRSQKKRRVIADAHRPVPDGTTKDAVIVPCNEAKVLDGWNVMAEAIGGKRLATRREGVVEECFNLPPVVVLLQTQFHVDPAPFRSARVSIWLGP